MKKDIPGKLDQWRY